MRFAAQKRILRVNLARTICWDFYAGCSTVCAGSGGAIAALVVESLNRLFAARRWGESAGGVDPSDAEARWGWPGYFLAPWLGQGGAVRDRSSQPVACWSRVRASSGWFLSR
jgi:hypothetical protein